MDRPLHTAGQVLLATVCALVLLGFLLTVAWLVAHVTVGFFDHMDHEITRQQTMDTVSGGASQSSRGVSWSWPAEQQRQ